LDRIGGSIGQVSIFLNPDPRGLFIDPVGNPPKQTGTVGGYPEYNGWVLITKDGRLPWIPQSPDEARVPGGVKPDPAFPDFHDPNRVQVIAVYFSFDADPRHTGRHTWGQQTKDTFDWQALAQLLK